MNFQRSPWIIGASALAIILLILFQVSWLRQSRQIVEEQFDQKVTMALCSVIDELDNDAGPISVDFACEPELASCSTTDIHSNIDSHQLQAVLEKNLNRYEIDLGFDFDVVSVPQNSGEAVYCSTMKPLTEEDHTLRVQFKGKEAYVFDRIGFMAGSSIFLLLFVCGLFVLTLFRLVQQRRLNAVSVNVFNTMAHEFRTPLTNISLALNLLQKRTDDQRNDRYLQVIHGESNRLQKQVECMLHVAKIDKGDYELDISPLSISALIREVINDLSFQIEEKQAQIEVIESDEGVSIQGDPLHLSNMIRNLIENALKYNEQDPHIRIGIESIRNEVKLEVRDNGIGMCEQECRIAFDPFHRSNNDRQGFGLGLYYVKRIVEKHNGRIYLQSRPNEGSTFTIFLPPSSH
jgi:two-component system phosphate regulon sensor histidine kinase PhoR